MIPDSFEYQRPTSLDEALSLKEQGAVCLAGGTDLVVQLRDEKLKPSMIVDIKALDELKGIRRGEDGLFIGAATPAQELAEHADAQCYRALVEGASVLGCYEIRQRATVGGNICNASPSA
ncbi:MAG: FAD binding domain-containing protein, partial [Coriobacteriales bacterium]|nr:FAD binding domain-containing protein [Coriobacteriales bacterium]